MRRGGFLNSSKKSASDTLSGPDADEFGRIALAEGLAPELNGGNNAREWWVVPKSEWMRTGRLTSN